MDLTDVPLSQTLELVTANPGATAIIPLPAIGSEIRVSAGETPGTFQTEMWTGGERMASDVYTPLQFAAVVPRLVQRHDRLLEMQGLLLAEQAERHLRELS